MTKNRLETLVDGIFAIAMTLLVLNIRIPVMSHQQAQSQMPKLLTNLYPHFFAFALSFALLTIFWMSHHRLFHFIEKIDEPFVWLNVLMLALIVLVPFTTSLIGEYETNQLTAVLFELNLFGIGMSIMAYWAYASRRHRLTNATLTDNQIRYSLRRTSVLPVVSLLAIGLSFVTPQYSTMAYLAIPVIIGAMRKE